jgi:hypothetical protein
MAYVCYDVQGANGWKQVRVWGFHILVPFAESSSLLLLHIWCERGHRCEKGQCECEGKEGCEWFAVYDLFYVAHYARGGPARDVYEERGEEAVDEGG